MSADRRAAERVVVISDVHANAPALEAVLRDAAAAEPALYVFGGDLTWGPLPEETIALVDAVRETALFVRGNAERALLEAEAKLRTGSDDGVRPRARWLVEHHGAEGLAFVRSFQEAVVVEVDGLGAVRFCHGSPRSDEEVVTDATPEERMRALLAGVEEKVLVTAHTHLRFDRHVAGVRSVNAGSVGMPYEGTTGIAYWAVLGPDVQLMATAYDVEETLRRYRSTDDPSAEEMVEVLLHPMTREELVAYAEARVFAG